jgi:hypothetical protein
MKHVIELTQEEFNSVLMALGYATGAATDRGDHGMAIMFLQAVNAVGKHSPHFEPYAIGDEEKPS